MNTDDMYVENMFSSWKKTKAEMRKKLPSIYENANEDIKTIISMLVESEYKSAIETDNQRSKNGLERKYAENYEKENEEIMKMIGC